MKALGHQREEPAAQGRSSASSGARRLLTHKHRDMTLALLIGSAALNVLMVVGNGTVAGVRWSCPCLRPAEYSTLRSDAEAAISVSTTRGEVGPGSSFPLPMLVQESQLKNFSFVPLAAECRTFTRDHQVQPSANRPLPDVAGFYHIAAIYPEAFMHGVYVEGVRRDAADEKLRESVSSASAPPIETLPWRSIVTEQTQTIVNSGILNVTTHGVHMTLLGRPHLLDFVANITDNDCRVTVYEAGEDPYLYEYPTLMRLQDYCSSNPTSLVWYLHSKGARYGPNTEPDKHEGVREWRRTMNHFIITLHSECMDALTNEDYDTCGATFHPNSNTYPGNFWWSRCQFINGLPRIALDRTRLSDRIMAERWLCGSATPCRVKACFMKPEGFDYYHDFTPSDYVGKTKCGG